MNTLDRRLSEEDRAEDNGLIDPDDRLTCHLHGKWIHQCVSSSAHVNQVTRHRWCRSCSTVLTAVVDELSATVLMSCPRCGDGRSAATYRLLAACRASIAFVHKKNRHLASVA